MACYHPSAVTVSRRLRRQDSPGDPRRVDSVTVPCGSCLGCRADQARAWSIRIMHESQVREPAYFLTLTYSDENLPPYGTLVPKDLSGFIKRLRKGYPAGRIGFYGCGEYGTATDRPHYHAVLFGAGLLDRSLHTVRGGAPVWTSATLADAWGLGLHEFTGVTPQAAAYVAGYVQKKIKRRHKNQWTRLDPESGELLELEPEFARMSRRPAIGKKWIERHWRDVYPRDYVVFNGREFKPPRYYDKWMEENQPELMEEVRHQRWLDQESIGDDVLIMKEKVHRARLNLFNKRSKV